MSYINHTANYDQVTLVKALCVDAFAAMSLPLMSGNTSGAVQSLNKVGTAYFLSLFFSKFKNIIFSKCSPQILQLM